MFPSIFTPAIAGLGPLTGKGSGLPIAGSPGRPDRVLRVQGIEAKDDDWGGEDKAAPEQGLKPDAFCVRNGTAEAVP